MYGFIRYLYEFCAVCPGATRHFYDMSTSFCEFVGVLHDRSRSLTSLYDLVRYTTICYDIYTRLVRQRTNLARLSTISHDFYTTYDAFKNKKVYMRFKSMVIFSLGLKSETNMTLQP